jgi:hypothetical protein
MLATGPKDSEFEPGQGDGILRAIKIRSTPYSHMGSKTRMSHVVRFYGTQMNSWSPTGIERLNSRFLRPSPTRSRDVSGDGQSALVDKLGDRPSWSRLLTGPHRYHLGLSAKTAVSPHHNNQSNYTACWRQSEIKAPNRAQSEARFEPATTGSRSATNLPLKQPW